MKNRGFFKIMVDALLILCGVLALVLIVPSSYGVSLDIPIIICNAAVFALYLSFTLNRAKHPLIALLPFLVAVAVCVVLDYPSVKMGARLIYYAVMRPPSLILPFLPIPTEPVVEPGLIKTHATAFVGAVAAVYAALVSFCVVKSRSPVPGLLVAVPTVLLSMVYTDMPPAFYAVLLLVIYAAGLLFCGGLDREVKKHAPIRLAFLLLLTVLGVGLSLVSPERAYKPIPFEQRQRMFGERIGMMRDGVLALFSNNPKQYELHSVANRNESDEKAFSVKASAEGSYLVKNHAYGVYDGSAFLSAPEYGGSWKSLFAVGETQQGETEKMYIQSAIMSERVVPYGVVDSGSVRVEEGFVRAYGETAYNWRFLPDIRFVPANVSKEEEEYYQFAMRSYTLPDGPKKDQLIALMDRTLWMSDPMAAGHNELYSVSTGINKFARDDHYLAAEIIASALRSFGTYTTKPGGTPAGREMIEYFLTDNKQGYCVHYASAAVAFMQALDIPARFVIGYRIGVPEADEWFTVTKRSAHAWAEVYIKGVGWVPLECTPGFPTDSGYSPYSPIGPTPEPIATLVPTYVPSTSHDPNTAPEETPDPGVSQRPERPSRAPRETDGPEPTPKASPTPAPGGSGGSGSGGRGGTRRGLSPAALLIIPAAFVLWQFVGLFVNRRRMRSFNSSDSGAAVISMLRYLKNLERHGLTKVPNAKEIGEEAAFSNHSMEEKQRELLSRCISVRRTAFKDDYIKRFILKRITFKL